MKTFLVTLVSLVLIAPVWANQTTENQDLKHPLADISSHVVPEHQTKLEKEPVHSDEQEGHWQDDHKTKIQARLLENLRQKDQLKRPVYQVTDENRKKITKGTPQILTVGASCDYPTINAALLNANSGDTIVVHGTTFTGANATVTIKDLIGIELSIIGGADKFCEFSLLSTPTVLDAAGEGSSVIDISSALSTTINMQGFIIQNGEDDGDGGGIDISGNGVTVNLSHMTLNNNQSTSGGGIYVNGSDLNLGSSVSITNNQGTNGGGIYCTGGNLSFSPGLILGSNGQGNQASSNGGGLYSDDCNIAVEAGTTAIDISGNSAGNGAGLFLGNTSLMSQPGTSPAINIEHNIASSNGGGLYATGLSLALFGAGFNINDNQAGQDGGGMAL